MILPDVSITHFPLGAHVRPEADEHVQLSGLGQREEAADVLLAGEVESQIISIIFLLIFQSF
jgi:hypothetical protein